MSTKQKESKSRTKNKLKTKIVEGQRRTTKGSEKKR